MLQRFMSSAKPKSSADEPQPGGILSSLSSLTLGANKKSGNSETGSQAESVVTTAHAVTERAESKVSQHDMSQQDRKEMAATTTSGMLGYDAQRMVGHGSFGAVFLAKAIGSGETVAIKKVLQDRRFKNRELQIMQQLSRYPHPCVVFLQHHFVTVGPKADETYLNLVLDYVPETLYSVAKKYIRSRTTMPILLVKVYMYQMARSLAQIHGLGVTHRDIKPQNLLVDPVNCVLKLCDFGSAKCIVPGEPNVAYICSRYYRAPELIFGSTEYTTSIDVWSIGCVMAELLLGSPIFPGSSAVDQLVEVIKVLGTPTKAQMKCMNPSYQEFKFPQLAARPLTEKFDASTPPAALDLLGNLFEYVPTSRPTAIELLKHEFFDCLREPGCVLPNGQSLPLSFFQFTAEEVKDCPGIVDVLVPEHVKADLKEAEFSSGRMGTSSSAGSVATR